VLARGRRPSRLMPSRSRSSAWTVQVGPASGPLVARIVTKGLLRSHRPIGSRSSEWSCRHADRARVDEGFSAAVPQAEPQASYLDACGRQCGRRPPVSQGIGGQPGRATCRWQNGRHASLTVTGYGFVRRLPARSPRWDAESLRVAGQVGSVDLPRISCPAATVGRHRLSSATCSSRPSLCGLRIA
jgi:hypothetical protein